MSEKQRMKIKKLLLEAVLVWNEKPFEAKQMCERAVQILDKLPICKGICYEEKRG